MDLAQLGAGHWLNLREDPEAFIQGTRATDVSPWGRVTTETAPMRAATLLEPTPQEMSPEAFQALQAEVRRFWDGFLPKDQWIREQTTLGEAEVRLGPEPRLVFERRGRLTVIDSMPKAILAILGCLLISLPPHALLRCPECHMEVFHQRKNQVYCSRQCVTRVNQRDRRAKGHQSA